MQLGEPTPPVLRSDQPSVAVLPFDNMSGDPSRDYFSDGITEDLITDLSQVSGLLVIASYNWGETRVLRLLQSMEESPRERNFWNLLTRFGDRIPQQTYDYVYRIVAAAVIGENPDLFGFDFQPPLWSSESQTARVRSPTEAFPASARAGPSPITPFTGG